MKHGLTGWQIYIQCRGNSEARERLFNRIWESYRKRLLYFIRNCIRKDAEDVFQEIMLKVFQNIETYNPFYAFNTWIYTIARNHCANHLGKRRLPEVEADPEISMPASGCASQENELIQREHLREIGRVIGTFDEENQQIVYLRFFEGMKYREIARTMDIPTGTVKSRVHACRKLLKEALESDHEVQQNHKGLLRGRY